MKSPVLFQNHPARELIEGDDRVTVSPEHGARILRWTHQGREVIHWPKEADWSHLLKVRGGDPVLFPFLGRHFVEGKNERWRDDTGVVRTMPQHGFARDASFECLEEPGQHLHLRLRNNDETKPLYPFAFQFDVIMRLHPNSRLEIRFETTNLGDVPLPYYAGHHFYLALPHLERSHWTLDLPCTSWGRQTSDGKIVRENAISELLRLDDPALIDRFQIGPRSDRVVLAQENGTQRLVLELTADAAVPWYAITTWTEKSDSDFYCVEPWLGLPNAIHHGQGLRWVAPGASETAACVWDASAW